MSIFLPWRTQIWKLGVVYWKSKILDGKTMIMYFSKTSECMASWIRNVSIRVNLKINCILMCALHTDLVENCSNILVSKILRTHYPFNLFIKKKALRTTVWNGVIILFILSFMSIVIFQGHGVSCQCTILILFNNCKVNPYK